MKGLKNYLEDFLLNNLVIDNKLQTIYIMKNMVNLMEYKT